MSVENNVVEGKYLTYLGQPLVREGDTICYGDKSKKFFLILDIMTYKKVNGGDVPDHIHISVVESKNPDNCVKQGDKRGMSEALSFGIAWLNMQNK